MGLEARLTTPTAGWVLSLYPQAAEAGGCFLGSRRAPRRWTAAGDAADPARAREEAARRARAKVRRYCAANRLNKLSTLTYAGEGCHDPHSLRRDVGEFFRALRDDLGRGALPYLWVPEWHKKGHGLHAHFGVARYIPHKLIVRAWGRGFVSIKPLNDVGVGTGTLGEARQAARYLSKYVTKDFDARRMPGLHRYEVAKGFQPEEIGLRGRSEEDVLDQACAVMGGMPVQRWSSADREDWQGPPAVWVSWA